MKPDWTSYDSIAGDYAALAQESYFAGPARDLVSVLDLRPGTRLIDVGTGTGAIAAAALSSLVDLEIFGCDASISMLDLARGTSRGVAASLPHLPFLDESFQYATLGFVLSHVSDLHAALREVKRVVSPGGRLGATSWAASPGSTTPGEIWQSIVHEFIDPRELTAALGGALPFEEVLASPEGCAKALREAGFANIEVVQRKYVIEMRTGDYVASRRVAMPSRYLWSQKGPAAWDRLVGEARRRLENRFGDTIRFETTVNIASGHS